MLLPIFPLNTILFPGIPLPLRVFEARYLAMLAERSHLDPAFGIALIESGRDVGHRPTFREIGTTARLVSLNAQSAHLVDVVVIGDRRIRIAPATWSRGYAMAETEFVPDRQFDPAAGRILVSQARESYAAWASTIARIVNLDFETPDLGHDPGPASFQIASRLPLHTWDQQALLEDDDPLSRMRTVSTILSREGALLHRGGVAGVPIPYPGERFTLN